MRFVVMTPEMRERLPRQAVDITHWPVFAGDSWPIGIAAAVLCASDGRPRYLLLDGLRDDQLVPMPVGLTLADRERRVVWVRTLSHEQLAVWPGIHDVGAAIAPELEARIRALAPVSYVDDDLYNASALFGVSEEALAALQGEIVVPAQVVRDDARAVERRPGAADLPRRDEELGSR